MRGFVLAGWSLAVLATSGGAWALEFGSVAEPAVLYDAPSQKAKPLFVIARQTPVEIVVSLGGWLKVRDATGGIAWIEKRQVSEQRTLLVMAPRAQIRTAPAADAPLAFEAEKEVVLELASTNAGASTAPAAPASGWAKVRHRDGQSGFIRADQVWGL